MSSNEWDDFRKPVVRLKTRDAGESSKRRSPDNECDWGQTSEGESNRNGSPSMNPSLAKFIETYERYLSDKKSLDKTGSSKSYTRNPQKELRDWFEIEGHEFKISIDEPTADQFICSIDLPVEDQDFTLTSEIHAKKSLAIDEVCLDACRMLDACQLLHATQSSEPPTLEEELARKKRRAEANKEDDIVFDQANDTKRFCLSASSGSNSSHLGSTKGQVNTYDSLMKRWTALNMNILQTKARLVRLDMSVTSKHRTTSTNITNAKFKGADPKGNDNNDSSDVKDTEDDEIDPLDEFMSSLETKTKLSMDEKIEKSRLKTLIAEYERQQADVARLLEIARPSFDTSKIQLGDKIGRKEQ